MEDDEREKQENQRKIENLIVHVIRCRSGGSARVRSCPLIVRVVPYRLPWPPYSVDLTTESAKTKSGSRFQAHPPQHRRDLRPQRRRTDTPSKRPLTILAADPWTYTMQLCHRGVLLCAGHLSPRPGWSRSSWLRRRGNIERAREEGRRGPGSSTANVDQTSSSRHVLGKRDTVTPARNSEPMRLLKPIGLSVSENLSRVARIVFPSSRSVG
ncbi:hypothetical protein C8R47DRAFT_1149052 [Mycena vitilis]|nr:hypothetical protein C8R47DRAFT_1149052 [Mycena vitilis]